MVEVEAIRLTVVTKYGSVKDNNGKKMSPNGRWWTATEYDASSAYSRYMSSHKEVGRYYVDKSTFFFSVRCLQD